MKYDRILIRYGELSTKGRNRNVFVDKLRKNVQRAIVDFPNAKVHGTRDRMYILLNGEDGEEIMNRIKGIFGITSFSPALKSDKDIDAIKHNALQLFLDSYKEGNTFKVSTRRSDKTYEYNTEELNQILGAHLLRNVPHLKVDVKNPDIQLNVEIRKNAAYLSCKIIPGVGGLPIGTSGKGMLMLSGGIDSPVAGYLGMKRGLEVEGVHFFSPPFTSERAKQKVIQLAEKLALSNGGYFTLHIVPFTDIQQYIHEKIPANYTMTTTRRIMFRIVDKLREKAGALAILTGESLGQVASQTLESMYAINAVTTTPILRPLVTMDKTEIIKIAKDIDTHDISILPYEDCCTLFLPPAPKTKPKKEKVEQYESYADFDSFIEEAIENVETIYIQPKEVEKSAIDDLF